jgi:hypothetical protein
MTNSVLFCLRPRLESPPCSTSLARASSLLEEGPSLQAQHRTLFRHRGTLNDAHKLILAVSKGLQKPDR